MVARLSGHWPRGQRLSRYAEGMPLYSDISQIVVAAMFVVVSLFALLRKAIGVSKPVAAYVPYLWTFFLVFTLSEFISFVAGVWVLALLCFLALREYFTLVDLRIQDRWGILSAYAAIPFMFYYVQTDWYGMFVITIPICAFLVVPFLVTIGGKEVEGAVLSIGTISLGLFLLVYCVGHIGYLSYYSTWMAISVVLSVVVCDLSAHLLKSRDRSRLQSVALQLVVPAPATVILGLALMPWTGIPKVHAVVLALLVPACVAIGCHTMDHLEADLRVDRSRLRPGRGEVINSLKSFLYAGPLAFHYLRYSLEAF